MGDQPADHWSRQSAKRQVIWSWSPHLLCKRRGSGFSAGWLCHQLPLIRWYFKWRLSWNAGKNSPEDRLAKKTKRRLFGRRDSREIRGLSSSSIAGSLSHHCTLALVIDVVRSLGISCRRFLWLDFVSFSGWIFPIAQLTFSSSENRGEPP
ncbi:hypothetical protein F9C07_1870174 [Aspergillus flavus]|uniref:Uncharacterized protein n=2 Tax=Aspergillus flavus TaxID=5059 RepID=A0A7U2MXS0_ASPFN|nr:hypothetical protein BDV35DRAFT_356748 [Aspergillus flavus]QRD91819.1 hypothetical protein F9C07_1870174 [Aspergillus flavus]